MGKIFDENNEDNIFWIWTNIIELICFFESKKYYMDSDSNATVLRFNMKGKYNKLLQVKRE